MIALATPAVSAAGAWRRRYDRNWRRGADAVHGDPGRQCPFAAAVGRNCPS